MRVLQASTNLCFLCSHLVDSVLQRSWEASDQWQKDGETPLWRLLTHHKFPDQLTVSPPACNLCKLLLDVLNELQDKGSQDREYRILIDRRNTAPLTMGSCLVPPASLYQKDYLHAFLEFFEEHDLNAPVQRDDHCSSEMAMKNPCHNDFANMLLPRF